MGVDCGTWDLVGSLFFQLRPPAHPAPPTWSLDDVLALPQTPSFPSSPSPSNTLLYPLFLTAMATGHRVSHLAALLRNPTSGPSISTTPRHPGPQAPLPCKDRMFGPQAVTGSRPHPLCPIAALRPYVSTASSPAVIYLWVDPISSSVHTSSIVASRLVRLISLASPHPHPNAHQLKRHASSLACVISSYIKLVRRVGHLSPSARFGQGYHQHHLTDVSVVVMGSAPNT